MAGRERMRAAPMGEPRKTAAHYGAAVIDPRRIEFDRSLSHSKSGRRLPLPASYFSLESLFLLVGLTVSLLILPLVLPPLPPPPFMLLLLPIGILGVLMVLAFMPSEMCKPVLSRPLPSEEGGSSSEREISPKHEQQLDFVPHADK